MTTPRDGLPATLRHGPCNAVLSPTCPCKPRQHRAPAAHQRALDNGSTRCHRFQQDAPSVPRTGAAVATSNGGFTAHFGSGVPSPLQFPCRFGVRDGQKHLPDINTPATTYRLSAASTGRRAELPMPWVPHNELKILFVGVAAIGCPRIRKCWKAGQHQPQGGIFGGISKLKNVEALIPCGFAGMICKTSTRQGSSKHGASAPCLFSTHQSTHRRICGSSVWFWCNCAQFLAFPSDFERAQLHRSATSHPVRDRESLVPTADSTKCQLAGTRNIFELADSLKSFRQINLDN